LEVVASKSGGSCLAVGCSVGSILEQVVSFAGSINFAGSKHCPTRPRSPSRMIRVPSPISVVYLQEVSAKVSGCPQLLAGVITGCNPS